MVNTKVKQVAGQFEREGNTLHLWFPKTVVLRDPAAVTMFFDEVVEDWIDMTPGRFYLLVDYTNLHIAAQAADSYSANIGRFQHKVLGTFRFAIPGDFTGVAVSLGNMKLNLSANLFESESEARAAIAHVQSLVSKRQSGTEPAARRSIAGSHAAIAHEAEDVFARLRRSSTSRG